MRPERSDEGWPSGGFANQVVKSRWLRIRSVNRVFGLTLTLQSLEMIIH